MSCQECNSTDVYLNNDAELTLDSISVDGVTLDTATVTYEIYDSSDEAVDGASGTFTAMGTGNYSIVVDKTIIALLTEGQEYTVRITGSQTGTDFEFNIPILVKRRGKI